MIQILRRLREHLYNCITELYWRSLTTKYLFDAPQGEYQPLPRQKKYDRTLRADETIARWEHMNEYMQNFDIKSLKDIGCCMGYFCHSAAEQGFQTFGFDRNLRFVSICNMTSERMRLSEKEAFSLFNATPETIQFLPTTDVTILLSVWHHWYFEFGYERALRMLQEIITKTEKILFFECGEEEIWEDFGFPELKSGQTASDWIESQLNKMRNVEVERLALSDTASYSHYSKKNQRTLFVLKTNHD